MSDDSASNLKKAKNLSEEKDTMDNILGFAIDGAQSAVRDNGEKLIEVGNKLKNFSAALTEKHINESDRELELQIKQLQFEIDMLTNTRNILKKIYNKKEKLSK